METFSDLAWVVWFGTMGFSVDPWGLMREETLLALNGGTEKLIDKWHRQQLSRQFRLNVERSLFVDFYTTDHGD